MAVTIDPTLFICSLLLLLMGVISFFLKGIISRIEKMHSDAIDRGNEIHKITAKIDSIENRVNRVEKDIDRYNVDIPAFYKEFPMMIQEAMNPQIKMLADKIEAIEKKR